MAASKLNLIRGCKVISDDKFSFKHKLIKFGFCFLISLNSGRYLPACLITQIGLIFVFLFIITSLRGVILKIYIIIVLVLCNVNIDDKFFLTFYSQLNNNY